MGDGEKPKKAENSKKRNNPKPYIGYVLKQGLYYKAGIDPTNTEFSNVVIIDTEAADLANLTGKRLMNVPANQIIKDHPSSWQLFMGRLFGFMTAHNDVSTTD